MPGEQAAATLPEEKTGRAEGGGSTPGCGGGGPDGDKSGGDGGAVPGGPGGSFVNLDPAEGVGDVDSGVGKVRLGLRALAAQMMISDWPFAFLRTAARKVTAVGGRGTAPAAYSCDFGAAVR